MKDATKLVRPLVRKLHPYVPGEQPKIAGLIKLNTNENPYPPSPRVIRAIKEATDERLRLYPNPTAQPLRERLAALHGVGPENVIVGNGSDELLALAVRAFVEPGEVVQYFSPSYSLYPVLAATHGANTNAVPLRDDFTTPSVVDLKRGKKWDFKAPLTLITTPNAPSGRATSTGELDALCQAQRGVVILDEAYVDFAAENGMKLASKYRHALVSRTFSKAYSLCFQRIGYMVGDRVLIEAMDKLRDSYNVNGLGQVAALATLEDLEYYRNNFERIIATREKFSRDLTALGFEVLPSQTNFIFAKPPKFPAEQWLEKLRANNILVRWFKYPQTRDYLRITIGTEREMKITLQTIGFLRA
ncbi:MAG TPA: histidinol-phosphate transaminase [Verrucomicrobiae bacterium]|nr:histidinol-phosphate transaminase [Verrucomicrobiae bacterium]